MNLLYVEGLAAMAAAAVPTADLACAVKHLSKWLLDSYLPVNMAVFMALQPKAHAQLLRMAISLHSARYAPRAPLWLTVGMARNGLLDMSWHLHGCLHPPRA